MGRIQRLGAQRWEKTRRGAALPPWGQAVGLGLVVVFVAWVGFTLLFSSSSHQVLPNYIPGSTLPAAVTTTTSSPSGSVTSSTLGSTPGANQVLVQEANGGTGSVDANAVTAAQAAATAAFTGNWSNVPVVSPSVRVNPRTPSASVTLSSPICGGIGGTGELVFSYVATLDTGATQKVNVTVVPGGSSGSWLVSSVG